MAKKLLALVFISILFISGCTCSISRDDMVEKVNELSENIEKVKRI